MAKKQPKRRGRIHYSSYWGTWSRVLQPLGSGHFCVEVDITPVNPGIETNWKSVAAVRIREHATSPDRGDEFVHSLPEEVFKLVGERIDGRIRHFIMTANILAMIDWEKYRSVCNGGAPLGKILKDGVKLPAFLVTAE